MITIGEIRSRVEAELRGKGPSGSEIDEGTQITDLGLSSLQISEIVFGMEEDYEVEFDAALAADAVTLGDLLTVANRALAEKAGEQPGTAAPAVAAGDSAPEAAGNGAHPMQPESVGG
ncbi:MAG TPA: acyl carrier protein [Solirubrobacteraceae bacterium]|nr:acyl carrier protein [Solirubrobacteraceae bacterium]